MVKDSQVKPTSVSPRGSVCYVFGILYPLFYLLSIPRDKQSHFLRFHSFQCLLLFAILVPALCIRSGPVNYVAAFLILGWFVAMFQAGRGKTFRLPLLGYLADRLA